LQHVFLPLVLPRISGWCGRTGARASPTPEPHNTITHCGPQMAASAREQRQLAAILAADIAGACWLACLVEVRLGEIGLDEVRPDEVCPAELRICDIGFAEIRPAEVGRAEVHPAEIGPPKIHLNEVRLGEVRLNRRLIFPPGVPSL